MPNEKHRAAVRDHEPSELAERVIRALQADVRRSAVEVAEEIDVSVPLARRTIARLIRSDWVRMRADFAHDVVGWNADEKGRRRGYVPVPLPRVSTT